MPRDEAYLLHFTRAFGHARHYLGVTRNLGKRLKHHSKGTGAVLLRQVKAAGIRWKLAQTWDIPEGYTPREFELKLKARGGHGRLCPICKKAMKAQRPLQEGRTMRRSAKGASNEQ